MKRLSQRIGELTSEARELLEESRHVDYRVRDNLAVLMETADCTRLLQERIEHGDEAIRLERKSTHRGD